MAGDHTYSFEPDALVLSLAAIKAYAYKFEEGFPTCRNWVYTESGGTKFSAQSSFLGSGTVCAGVYIQGPNAATRAWGGQVIGGGSFWASGPAGPLAPSEVPPEDQTAKFNSLHNSVDSSMRKFYGIPDGVLAANEAEKGWGVVDGIAVEDVSVPLDEASPSVRPQNVELYGYFTMMESNMSEMSGTTIDSVQSFVSKLKAVLTNIAKLAAYWNASLLSESSILKKTKASLTEACTNAQDACHSLSKGSDSSSFFLSRRARNYSAYFRR